MATVKKKIPPKKKGKAGVATEKSRQVKPRAKKSDAPVKLSKTGISAKIAPPGIPFRQVKNIVTDTVLRVTSEEFAIDMDELNAREHFGHLIAMSVCYGGMNDDGQLQLGTGLKLREHEFTKIPYCKEHK